MKRYRFISSLLCFFSLIFGLFIYLGCRENTYIHSFLSLVNLDIVADTACNFAKFLNSDFIKYYFVDFLWCFSFAFAFDSVWYKINIKSIISLSVFSFGFGVVFEILQFFNFCIGTFDLVDVFMYFTAALLNVMINIVYLKRKDLL